MSDLEILPYHTDFEHAVISIWQECGLVRPWNNPKRDIEKAVKTESAEILLGLVDGELAGTIMCGFDGHRGWIYYLAVLPAFQSKGAGLQLVHAAEDWLKDLGVPKVELMVRDSNHKVVGFYLRDGYSVEPVKTLSKWLQQPEGLISGSDQYLDITVTWLEMKEPPTRPALPLPNPGKPVSLTKLHDPNVAFYRYLSNGVGEPWFWYERRAMEDDQLLKSIRAENVEIYVLSVGNVPAGFAELTSKRSDRTVEITYFGLMPDFIGMKLGPYLLDWTIRTAWQHIDRPERLELNTCTLDHPSALATYQKAGFVPFRQEKQRITDPRVTGILPKDLPLPKGFQR